MSTVPSHLHQIQSQSTSKHKLRKNSRNCYTQECNVTSNTIVKENHDSKLRIIATGNFQHSI